MCTFIVLLTHNLFIYLIDCIKLILSFVLFCFPLGNIVLKLIKFKTKKIMLVRFFEKKVTYVHQNCIYMIKNTAKQ